MDVTRREAEIAQITESHLFNAEGAGVVNKCKA
jgi:hypothetical protein